jgi:hypothetical protein
MLGSIPDSDSTLIPASMITTVSQGGFGGKSVMITIGALWARPNPHFCNSRNGQSLDRMDFSTNRTEKSMRSRNTGPGGCCGGRDLGLAGNLRRVVRWAEVHPGRGAGWRGIWGVGAAGRGIRSTGGGLGRAPSVGHLGCGVHLGRGVLAGREMLAGRGVLAGREMLAGRGVLAGREMLARLGVPPGREMLAGALGWSGSGRGGGVGVVLNGVYGARCWGLGEWLSEQAG